MAGITSLVVAGALAAGGAAASASAERGAAKKAAARSRFDMPDASNLWGNMSYDWKKNDLTYNPSEFSTGATRAFQGAAQDWMGSPLGDVGKYLMEGSAGGMGGLYDAAQAYGLPPEALYSGVMGQLGGYQQGMGNLFGAAMYNPYAQEQMAMGRGLLGQDYSGVYNDRLGLLREQAAPFEERATNSLFNRLYGQGRLGSTGGGRDIEAFARGLGQADTSRQLDAMGFAEQLYGRDQAVGANLFSGGVGNYLSGLGQAGQLATAGSNMANNMYNLGVNWNELGYSRANDRMNRASSLFGFGQGVASAPATNAAQYLNLLSGISGEQANQIQLMSNLAAQRSAANAQSGQLYMQGGQASPLGAGLSAFGNAMMMGGGGMGGMFGGFGGANMGATNMSALPVYGSIPFSANRQIPINGAFGF